MSKAIKFKNENYLDTSSVVHKKEVLFDILDRELYYNSPIIKDDGIEWVRVATINLNSNYQRESIVISSVMTGNTDDADSGMALIGVSRGGNDTEFFSNITKFGNANIVVTFEGVRAVVSIEKRVMYRNLHIYCMGKSSNDWNWLK